MVKQRREQSILLNLAATCQGTRALGPGLRSVVWVQGCPFRCQGCIAPQWIPNRTAHLMTPDDLIPNLLADPAIRGLTFSGGEPFLQSQGLARLARLARQARELDIICYTGYLLEDLLRFPERSGVRLLLDELDVLIDGPYQREQNDNHGLRGSSNQRVHFLTERLRNEDFLTTPRKAEIHVMDQTMWVIGIPPLGMEARLNQVISQKEGMGNVRPQTLNHINP